MCPLVLVENEATYGGEHDDYQDLTGVSYHYPNVYKNKIQPGVKFVYYRGVRRKDNRRGQAEYFGFGEIGTVWKDPQISENQPKSKWHWYCSIENYTPFASPVPIKRDGEYFEKIDQQLGWRNGVRDISDENYQAILIAAGLTEDQEGVYSGGSIQNPVDRMVDISRIKPVELDGEFANLLPIQHPANEAQKNRLGIHIRRSRKSKLIGDRAEEVAYLWLQEKLTKKEAQSLRWISKLGETPGWDIEFYNTTEHLIAVEVKGTTGGIFQSIEITAGEWEQAKYLKERYWLLLVANCLDESPKISIIKNPVEAVAVGQLYIEPLLYRLNRV